MSLHDLNTLLIDAPVNRHFAQFHRDSDDATKSVALYVETGLRRKNGVLAVLGATHKTCCWTGSVWETFRTLVEKSMDSVQAFGRTTLRVYGELVSMLWQEGNADAAIRLEEFWNELTRIYPFSLFCSYVVDCYKPACYHGPLSGRCCGSREIGRHRAPRSWNAPGTTTRNQSAKKHGFRAGPTPPRQPTGEVAKLLRCNGPAR